ncbi:hypothetical protein GCM10009527_034190 [Actinomadura nitritigenes]
MTGIAAGHWTGRGKRSSIGLRAGADEAEAEEWTVSADSTIFRAHQHAAGARHVPAADAPQANDKNPDAGPGGEALGRSRGGLSTKIHMGSRPPVPADRPDPQPRPAQ